jgi:hypothetical protein
MGFGYLFLGYVIEYVLELNAYGALLYLPGYALIYLGLSNLQMYCHSFRYAKWLTLPLAVLAAYRTLEGAGRLFFFSVPIVTEQISRVVSLANMFLVLAFHVMLGLAIKDIALKTGVKRIAATALRNTVFAALYFCVAIPVSFMSSVDSILYGSLLILRLLWAILNSVLLYTCYMRICPAEEVQREAMPKPSRIGFVNKFREEFQKREDRAIAADREYPAENTRRRMEKKRSKAVLQAGSKAAKREEVKAAREAAKKRRDL